LEHSSLQDTSQLEKIQRSAARFVRNNYKSTTSVSHISWDQLSERLRIIRLTMMYKAVHGLVALPIDHLLQPELQDQSQNILLLTLSCHINCFSKTVTDMEQVDSSGTSEAFSLGLPSDTPQPSHFALLLMSHDTHETTGECPSLVLHRERLLDY
jgi:hypothetical protein